MNKCPYVTFAAGLLFRIFKVKVVYNKKEMFLCYIIDHTCVFDSSSISTIIDTNSNDVKSLSEPSVTEKVQEKLNNVNPVKSEVSTNSLLSSNSNMGTNTKSVATPFVMLSCSLSL
jgi:hypothetical protein